MTEGKISAACPGLLTWCTLALDSCMAWAGVKIPVRPSNLLWDH